VYEKITRITGVTNGVGTAYHSEAPAFIPSLFVMFVLLNLQFSV